MKKIFQMIGLISLTCFSFFVTEKTALVVNNMDEIMIEIKSNKDNYKTNYINTKIDEDTIIPGVCGKTVNINKSYKNMKSNGYYSDKLFIYDYKKPKVSLTDNIDKYIIKGNSNKRMISLIFVLRNDDDITDILKIIDNYGIGATFFIDYNWYMNNNNLLQELINKGHLVEPLFDDYSDTNYEIMDVILKKIGRENNGFCYNINENSNNLDICTMKGNYTITPIEISDKTPLLDVKSKVEPGAFLSFKVNKQLKKELSTIIIYIRSKGYELTNIREHALEEEKN